MRKVFNITGPCELGLHYMVDITERLHKIKVLVDKGEYFNINCPSQYGKTTTLRQLKGYLQEDYIVVSIDFQKWEVDTFKDAHIFARRFATSFDSAIRQMIPNLNALMKDALDELQSRLQQVRFSLFGLFMCLSDICEAAEKPVVLMLDTVDVAADHYIFLDLLAQIRAYFMSRFETPTFSSVIMAGVHDIRSLAIKMKSEDGRERSPYNIASDFNVEMGLSETGIAGMLEEYASDYSVKMDIQDMSALIYDYTSGYPFLVSYICKILDERITGSDEYSDRNAAWTKEGFLAAVEILLSEKNPLLEALTGALDAYPELHKLISLLLAGNIVIYSQMNPVIDMAVELGYVRNRDGLAAISNRIFETIAAHGV